MHRILIALTALAAACAGPRTGPDGPDDIESLVRRLGTPESMARLAAIGDPAVPALHRAATDPQFPWRDQAIRTLGLMWSNGRGAALEAYLEAVRQAPDDPSARRLLAHAHRFRDPEGRVFALLDAALRHLRIVTPEIVAAAGAGTDVEAIEAMMTVVGRSIDADTAPERDLAIRYIGRAARRGRREAVEFLRACTQSSTIDLVEKASAELSLLAGRIAPKSWSAWWFDHSAGTRKDWLEQAFGEVGGRPFDPGERDHVGEIVGRLPQDADAEPELWYLEQVLGRRFGYVSPRDVFDPDVDLGELSAANGRALATAREWWSENSPYLFFNSATGRYEISEEARRIGVPVDPRTGKPGR
jgi:hypothetical protein